MKFSHVLLAQASVVAALAAPSTGNEDIAQSCSTGYTIETFGSSDCNQFSQGKSNSGKDCNVCVEMGNARSWKILNPSHCSRMSVTYFHGAECIGNVARDSTYDTGHVACNAIPTDIGNHFSARFVCIS